MTRPLVLLVAAAAVFASSAAAEVPPPIYTGIAATHAQPVAGHTFTGITVTNTGQRINRVTCDARIGNKSLHGQQLRYFTRLVVGPNAVTCSWSIPAGASGKTLHVIVDVVMGGFTSEADSSASWRIR
jgi:hypothetical protein